MILDGNKLENSAILESDICIIGAGPAGIVAALELASYGLSVLLVEAGGLEAAESQASFFIETPTTHHSYKQTVRNGIGGTSAIWAGRCVELDPIDFTQRAHISESGWPIDYQTLAPFYEIASRYCDAAAANDETVTAESEISKILGSDATCQGIERWSPPQRFGVTFRQALENNSRITVVLNTTCIKLNLDKNNRIIGKAELKTTTHISANARATEFVICGGGLATTRLLLASNETDTAGLGNLYDRLGRYYMGHIYGSIATITLSTLLKNQYAGFRQNSQGVYYRRRIALTEDVQRNNELLNTVFYPDAPKAADPAHRSGLLSAGYLAFNIPYLKDRLASTTLKDAFLGDCENPSVQAHLKNIVSDFPRLAVLTPGIVSRLFLRKRRLPAVFPELRNNRYDLHYHAEQEPSPGNRVTLLAQKDHLGMPLASVSLQYSSLDIGSVERSHNILINSMKNEMGERCIEFKSDTPKISISTQARDGYHQSGTTRMSAQDRKGVVDSHCRVHGVKNLSIGSSSVFPTSGHANPTLTIVALSARIAHRLGHNSTGGASL